MKTFACVKAGFIAAAIMLAQPLSALAREEKVKLSDCPAAVQKTIKENANGGKILEIEKETKKDGTVVYEAEVKKSDGKTIEIEVAEDGKLLSVEDEDDEDDDKGDDDD
ncbi:MAG: hypothetical protein L0Y58_15200 [Verrucomicrobia subdivision 3 bacterium]|nr:hypothetical protein [Limisphaerales bacterium]